MVAPCGGSWGVFYFVKVIACSEMFLILQCRLHGTESKKSLSTVCRQPRGIIQLVDWESHKLLRSGSTPLPATKNKPCMRKGKELETPRSNYRKESIQLNLEAHTSGFFVLCHTSIQVKYISHAINADIAVNGHNESTRVRILRNSFKCKARTLTLSPCSLNETINSFEK